MKKTGALAGILFPILQMTAQGLIQIGGMEPSFSAPAAEILEFFQARDPDMFRIGEFLSIVSMIAFLWFLTALWDSLRSADGDAGWLAMVVMGSGLVSASALTDPGGWSLALFRLPEGLDPETARLLFDEGNLNFANLWVSLGSMVLAAGLSFHLSGSEPRWLSWSTIAMGIALVLARLVWTEPIAFAPYVLFWVWMILIGVRLIRRTSPK
ncbi:MAG TPA: hypothetical protein VMN57_03270 [Anaerolineales bacterium]|nr:hypothetical protein [Anaerolineales bacterium]